MGRHAEWEVVNRKPGIILIRDMDRAGCLSITNDAENVYFTINRLTRGTRVIYQDTQGDWTEIYENSSGEITFKPWYGEVWDGLTRPY
jgi:hypothetical protein